MAAAKKKLKTTGQKAMQASRSARNKAARIARHKKKGPKCDAYKRHLLSNRLRRLTQASKYKGFSPKQAARLKELQELLN